MDIEELIKEYKDKGGSDERIVREILQSKRKDIVQFMERMIHQYSHLSKIPFKVLVDLKLPDASIDFEKMEKDIDEMINYKPTVVLREAKPTPRQQAKPKPEKKTDYAEYAKNLINLFRQSGDPRTEAQILTEKSGPGDISLMEVFEYVFSKNRILISKAIQTGQPYFMEKSRINWATEIMRVLAKLEIEMTFKRDENDKEWCLGFCEVPNKSQYVSINGRDFMNNEDTVFLDKLKNLFEITAALQIGDPKKMQAIIDGFRQIAKQVDFSVKELPRTDIHDGNDKRYRCCGNASIKSWRVTRDM